VGLLAGVEFWFSFDLQESLGWCKHQKPSSCCKSRYSSVNKKISECDLWFLKCYCMENQMLEKGRQGRCCYLWRLTPFDTWRSRKWYRSGRRRSARPPSLKMHMRRHVAAVCTSRVWSQIVINASRKINVFYWIKNQITNLDFSLCQKIIDFSYIKTFFIRL